MAVLHLELQIDGEVYPELHAMLSSLGSDASRGERLRQLAASGLVWEYVRLRAPVSASRPVGDRATASTPPRAAAAVRPAVAVPQQAAAADPPTRATRPTGPTGPTLPEPAGFVDLAIDAPAPPAPRSPDVRPPAPPLLMDVIDDAGSRVLAEPSPEGPDADGASSPVPDPAAVDDTASTRARLLRMRDRGLFRNG